jgi:SAM-dependent methyltransferase
MRNRGFTKYFICMHYTDHQVKELLDEIIFNTYEKNPIILSEGWDSTGERNYIEALREQYENILRDFNSLLPEPHINKKVLEISSFLGVIDIALSKIGFDVYTFDLPEFQNNANLKRLFNEFNVHPYSGNVKEIGKNSLPYPDNYFDAVILSEVLEHLNVNPLPVLQEINRILKTDGIVYITTPNQTNLTNRILVLLGQSIRNPVSDSLAQIDPIKNIICGIHWREYTLKEIEELLEITGFIPEQRSYLQKGRKKQSSSWKEAAYHWFNDRIVVMFPELRNSITVTGRKKPFRQIKFQIKTEYIKYYPMEENR